MTNIESFNVVKDAGLKNSNFLVHGPVLGNQFH